MLSFLYSYQGNSDQMTGWSPIYGVGAPTFDVWRPTFGVGALYLKILEHATDMGHYNSIAHQTKRILGQFIKANCKVCPKQERSPLLLSADDKDDRYMYNNPKIRDVKDTKGVTLYFISEECTIKDAGLKMFNWNRLTSRIIVNQLAYPPCSKIMHRFHSRTSGVTDSFPTEILLPSAT